MIYLEVSLSTTDIIKSWPNSAWDIAWDNSVMPAGIYINNLFLKVKKMKRYNMHLQMCVQNSKLRAEQ